MVVGPHPGHTHSHQALLTKDIFDDHVAPDPERTLSALEHLGEHPKHQLGIVVHN